LVFVVRPFVIKVEWSRCIKKWGYDENREDLTYEHWYAVILPEDREMALQKVEEAKVFLQIMRLITYYLK
jgi:hypothetical protein